MPEIKLVNVSKRFGKIVAVDNVSLQVRDKEYFSLIGPSGCGKTTLLRIIAGLVEPDEGDIHIDNNLVNKVPPEDRGIGFVFQTYALFPHMDVWDNVMYGPRVKGWEETKSGKVGDEMLRMVRLDERLDAFPNELSGGMMQRVALGRALTAGAKLLLLDEPLGALDAKIRFELRYDLHKLVKDLGLTAIHVTHDQSEAMAISDRIAVMRKGMILQVGTPQELYNNPEHIFVANFIGQNNFLEGSVVKTDDDKVQIELSGGLTVSSSSTLKKVGERVVLAVRPEIFTIEKGHTNRPNSLLGVVERLIYEGTNIRYEVRLENKDIVVVERPSLTEEWFNTGDGVTVSFPSEKSRIFAYPSEGLGKELAVG